MKRNDYLKYWKIVRDYYKIKYKLSQPELDTLIYLYSESYFSSEDFSRFDNLFGWDIKRFHKMKADGWIVLFRRRSGKYKAIYQLSVRANRLVCDIYKALNGEAEISTKRQTNPLMRANLPSKHKQYLSYIEDMNSAIRQQRHHPLE